MDTNVPDRTALDRRGFLQAVAGGAGIAATAIGGTAAAGPCEDAPNIIRQPAPRFGPDLNTADIVVPDSLGRDPRLRYRWRRHQLDHRSAAQAARSHPIYWRPA